MTDFYKTFDPEQRYEEIMFRSGKGAQSREFNDVQAQLAYQIDSIGDAVFKDGDLIGGGELVVDTNATGLGPDQVKLILNEGTVYLQGLVRIIPLREIVVSSIGTVEIGVDITREIITELEDPGLCDPATGTRNFQEPGASRKKYTVQWEKAGDAAGEFFSIHTVENGVLIQSAPPPQMDNVTQALARYDRESNGHYIVSGLRVTPAEGPSGKQAFVIEEGKAHVHGFEVELTNSLRKLYDEDPDLSMVESEPHIFTGDADGKMRIDFNHKPVATLTKVDITARKTVSVLHGSFTGVIDSLPDTAVAQLIEVKQGTIVYTEGNDFLLTVDSVDWSPGGGEPAPGSTYEVTYDYRTDGTVELEDEKGVTVSGAVDGSLVLLDYSWKLPRLDRLAIDRDGKIWRLKGVSDAFRTLLPSVPSGQLQLAIIEQTWSGFPNIVNDGVRVVPMHDIERVKDNIYDLYALVATERLKTNANLSDPSSKRGIFVDPFFDDDLRDKGEPQTAAIVNGVLMLPIAITVLEASTGQDPWTLDFELESVLEQTLESSCMKINPYQSFPPVPARVSLEPAIDEWTEIETGWASPVTRRITSNRWGHASTITEMTTSIETTMRETNRETELMREREVSFSIDGFGPEENLDRVVFGGVEVINQNTVPAIGGEFTADNNGDVAGTFTVPANMPTGSVAVEFFGAGGSFGRADFISRGTITLSERRAVNTIRTTTFSDPLAQTFVLTEGRYIGGVDLKFCEIGDINNPVTVQIREVENGIPVTGSVLTQGRLDMSSVNLNDWTSITFDSPVYLEADQNFCFVVLTDDPDHKLAIAEIGKYDQTHGWITTQPYTVGVLLSSSNAATWTPHQTKDLTFRLKGARFIQASKTVNLTDIQANQISDLLALGGVDKPAADTHITLKVVDEAGVEYGLVEGEPLALPKRLNGTLSIRAELAGTETLSPVLFPNILAILGNMADLATYVSRAIPTPEIVAGELADIRVIYESNLPGSSGVSVEVETPTGWLPVSFLSGKQVGDDWEERRHLIENIDIQETRVRLTLTGDPLNRPRVRDLQVIIT